MTKTRDQMLPAEMEKLILPERSSIRLPAVISSSAP
jgi:hypothetical protein